MEIKVSVIVPVFNSEKYLKQCIHSLLRQDLSEAEFIFVDDGSTDHSVEILEEYREKDKRICVIKQKNENAGTARNRGLSLAKGKYMMFLDSDDFFKPNLLSAAYQAAEKSSAQIVIFDYYAYDDLSHKSIKRHSGHFPRGVFSIRNLGEDAFGISKPVPWNKIYLRKFVIDNNLKFQSIKRCNDKVFVLTALSTADRLFHLSKRLLFYRINNSASLQGAKNKNRQDFVFSLIELKRQLKNRDLYDAKFKIIYNRFAWKELISGMRPPYTREAFEDYYSCIKQNLFPNLFDGPDDFCGESTLKRVYVSDSFVDFLIDEYQAKLFSTVGKNSYEYKIGNAIMKIPRRLL